MIEASIEETVAAQPASETLKTYTVLLVTTDAFFKRCMLSVQERFDEMPEPKFLYGTHYSSPAHVLFFLARAGNATLFV